MPPSAAHQPSFGMPMFPHQPSRLSQPFPFQPPAVAAPASSRPALSQTAGRKRSRDEADINLDVEEAKLATIEPVKEPEDEWVYGEGMVLIKKSSAYVTDAGSQSGTWLEDKTSATEARRNQEARALNGQDRPSLRSHKSQRLDMNALSMGANESKTGRSSPRRDQLNITATTAGSNADNQNQPFIDNLALHLGIGWRRISDDEHIQAAARGWARYIENHFPVTNVQIQLESKGLQSYLVEASEGYFLFAENLRQGQLVSRDLNQAVRNLQVSPPVFEGAEVMNAASTPQATLDRAPVLDVEMDMN